LLSLGVVRAVLKLDAVVEVLEDYFRLQAMQSHLVQPLQLLLALGALEFQQMQQMVLMVVTLYLVQ